MITIASVMMMGLTACAGGRADETDDFGQAASFIMENEASGGDMQEQSEIKGSGTQEAREATSAELEAEQQQRQEVSYTDEELEEKLAVYRQVREDTKPVQLGNGVTMGGSVDPDKYGLFFDSSSTNTLDSRELHEVIDTANDYVENTLGISVETRYITYMCVDPRIYAIYSAEDKGVANGYEPGDIYLREYYDNGTWQYLILVRDGKGSAWEVIHHGSSFMEEG